jgi:glyoxylase-like metal-dependent hydrolase (beta-lactamase superfamily II)
MTHRPACVDGRGSDAVADAPQSALAPLARRSRLARLARLASTRRGALAVLAATGAGLGLSLLQGCAAGPGGAAASSSASSDDAGATPIGSRAQPLADGVWVFRGVPGDIGPQTLARHGNGGFVVGPRGVLVIDSGVSMIQGRERLAAIRATTRTPIVGVLLTHAMQDFIFGAGAFQDAGIPVFMHKDAAQLMTARCGTCLKTLKRELGDAAMQGTRVPKADRTFASASEARSTLPDIGRALRVIVGEPKAHTASAGATALLDETSGTLFAGALLDAQTVPDIQDADLAAWGAARKALRAHRVQRIVPGRGPLGDHAITDGVDRYLQDLQTAVDAFVKAGKPLSDVADGVELPAYAQWDRYESTHRRNASILYLRRERALIFEEKSS